MTEIIVTKTDGGKCCSARTQRSISKNKIFSLKNLMIKRSRGVKTILTRLNGFYLETFPKNLTHSCIKIQEV